MKAAHGVAIRVADLQYDSLAILVARKGKAEMALWLQLQRRHILESK